MAPTPEAVSLVSQSGVPARVKFLLRAAFWQICHCEPGRTQTKLSSSKGLNIHCIIQDSIAAHFGCTNSYTQFLPFHSEITGIYSSCDVPGLGPAIRFKTHFKRNLSLFERFVEP